MFIKTIRAKLKKLLLLIPFSRITIRHKIVILVFLLILVPMSFAGLYFYRSISSVLTKNATDNLSRTIRQTTDSIESSFTIVDNTSLHFLSTKSIRPWVTGYATFEGDYYKLFMDKSEIEEDLKYSLMFNNSWDMDLISTAYVFLNEDTYCSVLKSQPSIQTVNDNNIRIYKELHANKIRGKEMRPPAVDDKTIYLTRVVANINNPEQQMVVIIGTDEDKFSKKYSGLAAFPGAMVYIIDAQGVIYSSLDKSQLGLNAPPSIFSLKDHVGVSEVSLDKQTYFVASKKIGETELTFIAGIPKHQVLSNLSDSMKGYIEIILLIVFVSIAAGILLSLRFTRFIRDLLRSINKVKAGNYSSRMPAYKDTELNLLSDTFNNMTNEIEYLINEVYEKQLLIKETEFKFLQSQMNPHFLFNTLITIGYKARLSKDETIYKMVTSLIELLQAGIYINSHSKTTIREELEFVKFYLYLQKERFEDKLEYSIHVSDDTLLDYYLPKLCVQPIVENAVVHGLEKKMEKGTVDITIRREGNSVYFEIVDDGTGFESENINLDDDTRSIIKRKSGHNNIGLTNTNKRIKLMYGEQYGITIESQVNGGSRVTILIPADTEGKPGK